ncbi:hypothetical protein ACJX0J_016578, partial [Zea mays]
MSSSQFEVKFVLGSHGLCLMFNKIGHNIEICYNKFKHINIYIHIIIVVFGTNMTLDVNKYGTRDTIPLDSKCVIDSLMKITLGDQRFGPQFVAYMYCMLGAPMGSLFVLIVFHGTLRVLNISLFVTIKKMPLYRFLAPVDTKEEYKPKTQKKYLCIMRIIHHKVRHCHNDQI